MDLNFFQAMGALMPAPRIVQREVSFKCPEMKPAGEWANPDEPEYTGKTTDESMTVFIRRGSSADGLEILQAEDRDRPFLAIQRCIVDEQGKPVFPTLEEASRLKLWLALPLAKAIMDEGSTGPKASRRATSSGATSPSPSADAASANGSTPSKSTKKKSGAHTHENAAP